MKIAATHLRYAAKPLDVQAVKGGHVSLSARETQEGKPGYHTGESVPTVPPLVDQEAARQAAEKEGWAQGYEKGVAAATAKVLEEAQEMIRAAVVRAEAEATFKAVKQVEAQAHAAMTEQLDRIKAMTQALSENLDVALKAAEDAAVMVVLDTLQTILGEQAAQPEHVKGVVRSTLKHAGRQKVLQIEVHPGDLEVLLKQPGWSEWVHATVPHAEWVGTERVRSGGCVINTVQGRLDARLETQLESFVQLIKLARQDPTSASRERA